MSKYVKYTYVSTQNFVGIRSSKLFEVKSGHKKSLEVKQGSNPSIKRQIGPVGRNISNIDTFRLRILSEIDIQNYSRSYQVIKSHQRSNLSKTCQKRVKTGCFIQLYALYISKLNHQVALWSYFQVFVHFAPERHHVIKSSKNHCVITSD